MTIAMHQTRITLSPDVTQQVFNSDRPSDLPRLWIRYLKGLLLEDGLDLEDVVAPTVRCIDLDLAGLRGNLEGLRQHRDALLAASPDLRVHVLYMTVRPGQFTVETVMRCFAERGPAETVSWDVRTLGRFGNGRLIERWDRAETPVIVSQFRGAA